MFFEVFVNPDFFKSSPLMIKSSPVNDRFILFNEIVFPLEIITLNPFFRRFDESTRF